MQKSFQKIPLLLSLIFFLASIFSFLYLYQEIKNNSWEIDKKENEWRIEAIRREELKTLNNSIEAIKEERQQLETHFARSSDVVLFLNTVEGLAKGAGIEKEVRSVDISKRKKFGDKYPAVLEYYFFLGFCSDFGSFRFWFLFFSTNKQ